MWTTLKRGDLNRNAVLAEDVNNGDTVILRNSGGSLKAFRATVAGGRCDGFATIVTTDPNLVKTQPFEEFNTASNAFANLETLKAGTRVLIEEGTGTAETTRVVPGTYKNGDPLTPNGDGRLRIAGTGENKVAEARETRIIATGDKLYIEYHADVAHTV